MATSNDPCLATYGSDFRRLLQLDAGHPIVPAVTSPAGRPSRRLADHAARFGSTHGLVHYDASVVEKAGPEVGRTAVQKYFVLRTGVTFCFTNLLPLVADAQLTDAELHRIEDAVVAEYWRYKGLLLPMQVRQALLRGGESGTFRGLLDSAAGAIIGCADANAASSARLTQRATVLRMAATQRMTHEQTALAEFFCDYAYLQTCIKLDLVAAEAGCEGRTRGEELNAVYAAGMGAFEPALRELVRRVPLGTILSGRDLSSVRAMERKRSRFDQGVLDGAEPSPPRAQLSPIAAPTAPAPAPWPDCDAPTRREGPLSLQPPLEWSHVDPPFLVPEWRMMGFDRIRPADASRHFIITGETGSGKTASAVLPLTRAALRYDVREDGTLGPLAPALLVIDPKREITDRIRAENLAAGRDLIEITAGPDGRMLDLFEGCEPLDMTPTAIVKRMLTLSDSYLREWHRTTQAFFVQSATQLLVQTVAVDSHLYRTGGTRLLDSFWDSVGKEVGAKLGHEVGIAGGMPYPHAAFVLLNLASQQRSLLGEYRAVCARYGVPAPVTLTLSTTMALADETYSSIMGTFNNVLAEVASQELAQYIWLDPFRQPPAVRTVSIRRAIAVGDCVCYCPPDASAIANYVGRALKTRAFEFTFTCSERRGRGLFYIADECHRFIGGGAHEEHAYLDRCRAFRAVCVLATQSLASLKMALVQNGSGPGDEAALDVMLANTGSKLFFRSTDPGTQSRLTQMIPHPQFRSRPHLCDVRPVSTLGVGECYYLLSTGSWGRNRICLGGRTAEAQIGDRVAPNPAAAKLHVA
jgi:hypothetical protein